MGPRLRSTKAGQNGSRWVLAWIPDPDPGPHADLLWLKTTLFGSCIKGQIFLFSLFLLGPLSLPLCSLSLSLQGSGRTQKLANWPLCRPQSQPSSAVGRLRSTSFPKKDYTTRKLATSSFTISNWFSPKRSLVSQIQVFGFWLKNCFLLVFVFSGAMMQGFSRVFGFCLCERD